MATVDVTLMGPLRRPEGLERGKGTVEIPREGCHVEALLDSLGFSAQERQRFQILVNNQPARTSTVIRPGEQLTLFLPLGGG